MCVHVVVVCWQQWLVVYNDGCFGEYESGKMMEVFEENYMRENKYVHIHMCIFTTRRMYVADEYLRLISCHPDNNIVNIIIWQKVYDK